MHSPTPPWLVVAKREFFERVRTKWFVVVTTLGPLALVGLFVLPVWVAKETASETIKIHVVDRTGRGLGMQLETVSALAALAPAGSFEFTEVPVDTAADELKRRIRDEEIHGFLDLPPTLIRSPWWLPHKSVTSAVVYRGINTTSLMIDRGLKPLIERLVHHTRARDVGVGAEYLEILSRGFEFETLQTTGSEETSGEAATIVGYIVVVLLYMAILLYAVNVLRSVVSEKTNRVVEIITASVKPRSLMLGKILGVGAVGLFQLSIWGLVAIALIRFRGQVLGLFGLGPVGGFSVPSLTGTAIALILVFFVLGFLFFAALYAAIGAMVSSEQEAQQAQTPIALLLIVPLLCMGVVAADPRSVLAIAVTQFPFSSPVLMPMRYLLGGAEPIDVALSIAILVLSISVAIVVAARVYRVGILVYGKRASLREVLRWMRHTH